MAAKKQRKGTKEYRGKKWSDGELREFAYVLADDQTEFALTLETLALKRSANVHIFENIKKELDARLQSKNISLSSKKGKERAIDTSVAKLRTKYKWLKTEWKRLTDRAKSGSGQATIDEPEWFKIIDPIFSETHAQLKVATKADDILTDSEEGSEGGKSSDDDDEEGKGEVEERKLAASMVPRERKQPFNSSASSLDARSELSHCSGDESEEVYSR